MQGYQTRYSGELRAAMPGQLGTMSPRLVQTFKNSAPKAKQIESVTVTGVAANGALAVSIQGVEIQADLDAAPTVAEGADALAAAINAEPLVNGTVVAESDGVDPVTITARLGGIGFSFEEADANLNSSTTQANAEADPVKFGRALVRDRSNDGDKLAKLAKATGLTARSVEVSLTNTPDGRYSILLEVDGEIVQASFDAVTSTVDAILAGLAADFASDHVTATADAANDKIVFTATVAGFGDFRVVSAVGPNNAQLDIAVAQAGDDIRDELLGFSIMTEKVSINENDEHLYAGGSAMNVLRRGDCAVDTESAPSIGDRLYVRLAANGALDDLGKVRTDFNAGCVPLPKEWRVAKKLGDKIALIERV
jgi:hypothetical protein